MSQATEEKKPSYESINYRIRPAKSIERKMLCDSFRRLTYFSSFEQYRYIGFGSPFFADFMLFHKQLGIEKMISIEKDIENQDRFNFNKPYKCIEMKFGESNDQLPDIDWGTHRDIVWLDYDGHLDQKVLTDINTVFYNISSGSVVTMTVNVHFRRKQELPLLKKLLKEKTPENLNSKDLEDWKAAEVCKQIMLEEITHTLQNRNRLLNDGEKYIFQPLYYFGYKDGARMLTFGGIIYSENEAELFKNCNFTQLPYIKTEDTMYLIDVPSLTYKEIRYLDSQLPHDSITEVKSPGIKSEDITRYSTLYKYFPTFSETEI
ncbi:O-methyltransferase [Priestia megaterium]|uniref:O-methyltransferase n=1 Tax=Priestia megaterium TaxID=1404 RepID=UPI003248F36E